MSTCDNPADHPPHYVGTEPTWWWCNGRGQPETGHVTEVIYRWSSRAVEFVHLRAREGQEWMSLHGGIVRSRCACGIWDSSAIGAWQEGPASAVPAHLTLCMACLVSPRSPLAPSIPGVESETVLP